MAERTSNSAGRGSPVTSRGEIDALIRVVAATLALSLETRSVAASALLERALHTLEDRARAMDGQRDGGGRDGLRRP